MTALRTLRRAQWRRPSSLMSPTDEDAAEDVADDVRDDGGVDAGDPAAAHSAGVAPAEPLQPTGAAPMQPVLEPSALSARMQHVWLCLCSVVTGTNTLAHFNVGRKMSASMYPIDLCRCHEQVRWSGSCSARARRSLRACRRATRRL